MTPTPAVEKGLTRRILTLAAGRATKADFEAQRAPAYPPARTSLAATAVRIVPSAPLLFPLATLLRAPENVRHVRSDEDVSPLAEDIAAHGLLQSLIGYQRFIDDVADKVMIVGGGRRLQALQRLWDEGLLDGAWKVPVLIRDVDEAVELSLAENLQQRTMSPVDEFFAFKKLMDRGDTSPAELAKRFGFSERVVKQRLRLAQLATPVLDALADGRITLDAAMAYASSQDQVLQQEVFEDEDRRGSTAHATDRIRFSLAMKTYKTDDPLFQFVGAEAYERRGGGYEDDLFAEKTGAQQLATPFALETAAREMIEFQMLRRLPEFQRSEDLSPSISGFVVAASLRVHDTVGNAIGVTTPPGYVKVESVEWRKPWAEIRRSRTDVKILVGIDDSGQLSLDPRVMFVEKRQRRAVEQQRPASPGSAETEQQRQLRIRRQVVERNARHAAAGPFTGTFLENRVFWPEPHNDRSRAFVHEDGNGWLVSAEIFVTDDAIAAHRAQAEAEYDAALATTPA
ncbi:ParB/RepB/Spo0J family partition protein [Sphingomonas jinjuensis]|uniref:ParB/RepB/Spo0J family partition protein n=1 Tax=Sphingomonas jinjuensis TaxID=535907 RepID=A0A840F8J7_9SPHN|nr:ParB/RepB/Spo0J family partition protein [Sphingomonas jinjuensis]MBB4152932.1 ParB/RepB/Spo0J family partition protein [Sphingomonas jinjuensis]